MVVCLCVLRNGCVFVKCDDIIHSEYLKWWVLHSQLSSLFTPLPSFIIIFHINFCHHLNMVILTLTHGLLNFLIYLFVSGHSGWFLFPVVIFRWPFICSLLWLVSHGHRAMTHILFCSHQSCHIFYSGEIKCFVFSPSVIIFAQTRAYVWHPLMSIQWWFRIYFLLFKWIRFVVIRRNRTKTHNKILPKPKHSTMKG